MLPETMATTHEASPPTLYETAQAILGSIAPEQVQKVVNHFYGVEGYGHGLAPEVMFYTLGDLLKRSGGNFEDAFHALKLSYAGIVSVVTNDMILEAQQLASQSDLSTTAIIFGAANNAIDVATAIKNSNATALQPLLQTSFNYGTEGTYMTGPLAIYDTTYELPDIVEQGAAQLEKMLAQLMAELKKIMTELERKLRALNVPETNMSYVMGKLQGIRQKVHNGGTLSLFEKALIKYAQRLAPVPVRI